MKKATGWVIAVGVIVVAAGGYFAWQANSGDKNEVIYNGGSNTGGAGDSGLIADEPSLVPAFPGSTMGDSYTEDGLSHAEYETGVGVTAEQVLDFYMSELSDVGWQVTLRDEGDSRLEMLSNDGEQLRVSIFFTGYGDQGVVYFVDNRAPGGEPWPAIMMQ